MSCLTKIDTFDAKTGDLNVIVETPQGSRNKYKYDDELRLFKVHKLLPAGAAFPFDFGFIPSTLGDDGDPLDVLVIMEEPASGGTLVPARLIGVVEAEQTEDGEMERNDRLIAVFTGSRRHSGVHSLDDLGKGVLKEIEHFFISYNEIEGREFKPIGRHGPGRAQRLVQEGQDRYQQQQDEQADKKKKKSKAGK